MQQKEYFGSRSIENLREILDKSNSKSIFLVTGRKSYRSCGAEAVLKELLESYDVTRFYDFSVNPKLEDVEMGLKIFREHDFDMIIAVGGGSVIDMGKLINIFAAQKGEPLSYIRKENTINKPGKFLVAIPTTAGSGSEATHFAVVYVDGVKYSLTHRFILPTYAIVDPLLTLSMPKNVAATTGMDAFSQAIESYWSINSTDESKSYSEKAIKLVLDNIRESVNTSSLKSRKAMAEAAHLAGKAINIAKTTAPHALSYTITSRFGIPHGHAVALTLGRVLEYNAGVTDSDCNDKRGKDYVRKTIRDLVSMLGCSTPREANHAINEIMKDIGLETNLIKLGIQDEKIEDIINNINYERLMNNPRKLNDKHVLRALFKSLSN